MADFTLRPMEPSDGPAMDILMRNEAHTTAMSITTHYRHDVYQALVAEHPSLFGVVATWRRRPGRHGHGLHRRGRGQRSAPAERASGEPQGAGGRPPGGPGLATGRVVDRRGPALLRRRRRHRDRGPGHEHCFAR